MRKGIGAWLMLGAMLAVPAFIFWNWSKGMNPPRSARAITGFAGHPFPGFGSREPRNPPSIPFQKTAHANQVNTIPAALPASRPAAAAGAGPNVAASRMVPIASNPAPVLPAAAVTGVTLPAPANRPNQTPSNVAHGAVAPSPAVPQARIFTSTMAPAGVIAFNPATDRDPTLSPSEIEILRERLEAPHKAPPPPRRKAERKPTPELRVRVSGIVQVGSRSFTAIVNDQIHKVGDTVNGCKILKISSSMVTFQFRDKKFSKTVPK